jgi:hypothetical protein
MLALFVRRLPGSAERRKLRKLADEGGNRYAMFATRERRGECERESHCHKPWMFMAGTTGLEPATSAVTGQRSNQLSYVP